MNLESLPDLLTSADIRKLLNLSSSGLANTRRRDSGFPAPDPKLSRIRSPRWQKAAFLRWMVSGGLAPVTVLPDLDPPVDDQPVRWRYLRTEFTTIETVLESFPSTSYQEQYALMRYAPVSGGVSSHRVLTVAFVVDEPDEEKSFSWAFVGSRLTAATAAAIGYGPDGLSGSIVWMDSVQGGHKPYLQGVEVPETFDRGSVQMGYVDPQNLAAIVGHRLPFWWPGYASGAAVAMWIPEPANAPTPVFVGVPPVAASRARMRQQLRLVVDEIASGVRTAPADVPAQLSGLGNAAWDQAVRWYRQPSQHPWVDAVRRVMPSHEEPDPVLSPVPPETDIFEGLAWLVAQDDLDPELARSLTDFYGFPESIVTATVDLAALPARLAAVIEASIRPVKAPTENWMRRALAPSASAKDLTWIVDGDHRRRPVIVDDGELRFHVPRTLPDGFTPETLHLVARGEPNRSVMAFGVDRRGLAIPLPVVKSGWDRVAQCLAAVALSISEPVSLGNTPKLWEAPDELNRMVSALETTDHLEVSWSVISSVAGSRPAETTDAELREASVAGRLWKDREGALTWVRGNDRQETS